MTKTKAKTTKTKTTKTKARRYVSPTGECLGIVALRGRPARLERCDELRVALAKMEAERDGVRAWRDLYTLERNEARRERDNAISALREWSEKVKTELAKAKKELETKLDVSEKALADAITARDRYRSELIETEKARAHQRVELDGLRKVRDERDKTRLALEEQIAQTARFQASLSEVHDALSKGGVRWNANCAARVEELLKSRDAAVAERVSCRRSRPRAGSDVAVDLAAECRHEHRPRLSLVDRSHARGHHLDPGIARGSG